MNSTVPIDHPQNSMPRKPNRLLISLVSTLVLVSISVIAYFIYLNRELNKQLSEAPTEISAANWKTYTWKTYTSAKLNFKLKYPRNWESPIENDKNIHFKNSNSELIVFVGPHYNSYLQRNLTFKEYARGAFGDEIKREDYNLKTLVGKRAILAFKDGSVIETVVLSKDNTSTTDIITFSFRYSKNSPEKTRVFDQILSTFKFLD